MKKGLEFGRDCETNRPIRVAVEGNILSIAPPRRSKTSDLALAGRELRLVVFPVCHRAVAAGSPTWWT
jgi:hypothetical protein